MEIEMEIVQKQTSAIQEGREHKVAKSHLPLPWAIWFWTQARKIVVFVIGMTLIGFGIAGLMLPVLPGWLTIFGGLAVLATEFAWARWTLRVAKDRAAQLIEAAQKQFTNSKKSS